VIVFKKMVLAFAACVALWCGDGGGPARAQQGSASAEVAVPNQPVTEVLGVKPGMSEEEAVRLLDRVGRRQVGQGTKAEVWGVRDDRLAHVAVRFSRDHRVRHVTGLAHRTEGGGRRRVRYAELGDTARARLQSDKNNYTYTWRVEPRSGFPGYVIVARGSDPVYLTSYSLYRIIDPPGFN